MLKGSELPCPLHSLGWACMGRAARAPTHGAVHGEGKRQAGGKKRGDQTAVDSWLTATVETSLQLLGLPIAPAALLGL